MLRDIQIFFEHKEEENYYKPVRVNNIWSKNCIAFEINGDENKTLSVEEYFNKISPYLKDIINTLKKSGTWKMRSTTTNNIISSIDKDEEQVMHSKSDKVERELLKELFDSLKNRYQNNLKSMKGSEFIFDCLVVVL